jgi:hypothetical protein
VFNKIVLTIAFSCFFITSSWGTTYYVSKSGNDYNAGTSWATAWLTTDIVQERLNGGDTVFFGTGIWRDVKFDVPDGSYFDRTCYACSAFADTNAAGEYHFAKLWGSDSVGNWTNYGGNKWWAEWTTNSKRQQDYPYTVSQNDSIIKYASSEAAITEGTFWYDAANDRIYLWCWGDANPNNVDMEVSCHSIFVLGCISDADYATIYGFDIRYGSGQNIWFCSNSKIDSSFIDHCYIRTVAENVVSDNCQLIYAAGDGPNLSEHCRVRSCSLLGPVYCPPPNDAGHRLGIVLYAHNYFVTESCYVAGMPTGIDYKNRGDLGEYSRNNIIRYNIFEDNSNESVRIWLHAYHDSVYGNIFFSDDVGVCIAEGLDPIGDSIFVLNNTFYGRGKFAYCSASGFEPIPHKFFKYNVVYNMNQIESIHEFCYGPDSNTWFFDHNMYYINNPNRFFENNPGTYLSLLQWKAPPYNQDPNGIFDIDPGFDSATANNPRIGLKRSRASGEMYETYDGKTWTVYGAIQNDDSDSLRQILTVVDTTWSTIDIENDYILTGVTVDATEYQWSIDNFVSFVGKDTVLAPSDPDTIQISGLDSSTAYQIRAISLDASVGIIDTSSTLTVQTPPIIQAPDTLGTIIDGDVATAYASTVDPGLPIFYQFELDTIITFPAPLLFIGAVGASGDTVTTMFEELNSGIEYRWRVRAVASHDTTLFSAWSPVVTFSLGSVAAEGGCTGISPPEGATIETFTPVFEAFCEDANNYIYFQVDDDIKFDSPIESGPVTIAANNTASWQIPQPLSNEMIYFWRAGIDNVEWFSPMSFRVRLDIYAYPVPFRPQDGHSNITFTNLPEQSRVTIATISGSIVKKTGVLKGGDWVWDVGNDRNETKNLASGVYLYAIEFPSGTSRGKLMVIR